MLGATFKGFISLEPTPFVRLLLLVIGPLLPALAVGLYWTGWPVALATIASLTAFVYAAHQWWPGVGDEDISAGRRFVAAQLITLVVMVWYIGALTVGQGADLDSANFVALWVIVVVMVPLVVTPVRRRWPNYNQSIRGWLPLGLLFSVLYIGWSYMV